MKSPNKLILPLSLLAAVVVKDKTGEATVLFNIGKDYDWGFDRQSLL